MEYGPELVGLPCSLHSRSYPSMIVQGQAFGSQQHDMNIFLLNNQNIQELLNIFAQRQAEDQSLWSVDVTDYSGTVTDVLEALDSLESNYDDVIKLFRVGNLSYVKLWEVYKISGNTPMKVANSGYWSEKSGIILEDENPRNQRLRDLQGLHLKLASKVSKPYISEMIPNIETTFEMNGVFAEVFYNLQV